MAAMALEDVVKQLQVNKRSTDDVRKVLTDFILMTKSQGNAAKLGRISALSMRVPYRSANGSL